MSVSDAVLQSFRNQIKWCRGLGSPFTARLLQQALLDLERGGLLAELIGDWPGDPVEDALPLRLAGALHALVLSARPRGWQPSIRRMHRVTTRCSGKCYGRRWNIIRSIFSATWRSRRKPMRCAGPPCCWAASWRFTASLDCRCVCWKSAPAPD
ncbi:DUF2332 family protein [Dongia soli]|uniref:DUF2332 family protein n=1 Tax=Dongia soli TaxID=600628 RepID=UPI00360C0C1C